MRWRTQKGICTYFLNIPGSHGPGAPPSAERRSLVQLQQRIHCGHEHQWIVYYQKICWATVDMTISAIGLSHIRLNWLSLAIYGPRTSFVSTRYGHDRSHFWFVVSGRATRSAPSSVLQHIRLSLSRLHSETTAVMASPDLAVT